MNKRVLASAFLISGCCSSPWKAHPMATSPDRQCRTGTEAGYDVYIWECIGGERVVLSSYSSPISCSQPVEEKVACGKVTAIETRLGAEVGPGCTLPPSGYRWP